MTKMKTRVKIVRKAVKEQKMVKICIANDKADLAKDYNI
jgi:hypothetical protein